MADGPVIKLHSIARALDFGDRRAFLVALREKLWEALEDERTQPRDLSPLTLRLKELQAEIADLDEADQTASSRTSGRTFRMEDL